MTWNEGPPGEIGQIYAEALRPPLSWPDPASGSATEREHDHLACDELASSV